MFFDALRAGGPGMVLTLLCGAVLVGTALRYAAKPAQRYVPLLISLGLMTLFSGGLGFTVGMIKACAALKEVGPDERFVTVIGFGESLNNVALSLTLCLLATVAAAVGATRVRTMREA
jgi:hypothetical protein